MKKIWMLFPLVFLFCSCDKDVTESSVTYYGFVTLIDQFGKEMTDHSGVVVRIGDKSATSREDGRYFIQGVAPGGYMASYTKEGFTEIEKEVHVLGSGEIFDVNQTVYQNSTLIITELEIIEEDGLVVVKGKVSNVLSERKRGILIWIRRKGRKIYDFGDLHSIYFDGEFAEFEKKLDMHYFGKDEEVEIQAFGINSKVNYYTEYFIDESGDQVIYGLGSGSNKVLYTRSIIQELVFN